MDKFAYDLGQSVPVPGDVQLAARRALDWHEQGYPGGTPVGLNTAEALTQDEVEPFRPYHVSQYFPRHAKDKGLGQTDPPSRAQKAWDLWGGDSGRDWANDFVSQLTPEQKSSLSTILKQHRANLKK